MKHSWPVEPIQVGRVSMGTILWRRGEELRVTVIAKAAFALVPGGDMAPVDPPEIYADEVHHSDNPMRSIRASSDLIPYLDRTDVLVTGFACAPSNSSVYALTVRLAVLRGGAALLDKALAVYGDRAATLSGSQTGKGPNAEREPFQSMPLIYERAYGGIGLADNPFGTPSPNIVHRDPARRSEPAGFGPISWDWPQRKRLLHGGSRKFLQERIIEIPEGLDPAFFQSAPEDQRIPHLQGDEIIVLEGVHPAHRKLETRLPGVRGVGRVYTRGVAEPPFPLNADTLLIDADAARCAITFRGSFPVPNEESLEGLSVAAGVELGNLPLKWPPP